MATLLAIVIQSHPLSLDRHALNELVVMWQAAPLVASVLVVPDPERPVARLAAATMGPASHPYIPTIFRIRMYLQDHPAKTIVN